MLVCIGNGFGRSWLFADFVLTFIPTLYQQRERDASGAPSTQIKEGCAMLLWAYLRDYRHENTTSQSSVGGRSVIVSCQTSKVPLTASYLTFSSNEFIFHCLVFWQRCHLWPDLALFSSRVYCEPVIRVCGNCIALFFCEKKMLTPSGKGHNEQLMNGRMHQCCRSL